MADENEAKALARRDATAAARRAGGAKGGVMAMSMENRTSFAVKECLDGDTLHRHHMPNGGYITVRDRMTGYGYRDIETGYRCPSGQFWLASGGHDIRCELHRLNSDDEMAQWVIDHANTCTGGHDERRVGSSLEWLLSRENWKPKAERAKGAGNDHA